MPAERELIINITEKRTGNALVSAARDLDKMAHGADAAGDKFQGLSKDTKTLERDIRKTEEGIRDLGSQFARTGDESLFGDLRKQRSFLAELKRLREEALGKEVGFDTNKFMGVDFSGMIAESRGVLIAGAAGLGAAMAPVLAGIISSAVVGAVGAGGVVGGVILAARDERVKSAWATLGNSLMDDLRPVGEAFVEPIIRSADTLHQAFRDSGLVQTLQEASGLVEPMTEAFAGFIRELGPGLQDAIEGSLPTWRVLAKEMPDLGRALSYMFRDMRAVGPEAALAMKDFFDVLETGTRETGDLLAGLTELYQFTRGIGQQRIGGVALMDLVPWTGLIGVIGKLKTGSADTTSELDELAKKEQAAAEAAAIAAAEWEASADALQHLNEQLYDAQGFMITADEAADRINKDMLTLTQSVYDNGVSLDDHTEAGLNNREMIRGLLQDLRNQYEANVKAGMSTADATRLYNDQATALQTNLTTQLGFAADGVANLIGMYKQLPPVIDVKFRETYEAVGFPAGEHSGLRFGETYTPRAGYGFQERAMGGPVVPGGTYLVGENGPEWLRMGSQSGYVMPNMGGGMSGGTTTISFAATGDPFLDAMVRELRKYIRVEGGDVQVVLGN